MLSFTSKNENNIIRSVSEFFQSRIPIFVPCFNAVSYARLMVNQLRDRGFKNIILVDNASTYGPMKRFLRSLSDDITVIHQNVNKGPRDIFLDPISYAMLPKFFCVTDPDLSFNKRMPRDFVAQLAWLTETRSVGKAGLALDISDRSIMRQDDFKFDGKDYKIWDWEGQFWHHPLEPLGDAPVYLAPVDTTFSLYNKAYFDPNNAISAVRVAGDFTCRHLPWYLKNGLNAREESYYKRTAKDSFYLRHDPHVKPRYEAEADSAKRGALSVE